MAGIIVIRMNFPVFFGLVLMASADHRAAARNASPIPMERFVRRFQSGENVRRRLIEAGATGDLPGHPVAVFPADRLEDARFAFAGSEVAAHSGRDISAPSFAEILHPSPILRPWPEQFEKSLMAHEKVMSRHRSDFSDMWVVEYSRVIDPVTAESGSACAIGHDVFHDHTLEGRYF